MLIINAGHHLAAESECSGYLRGIRFFGVAAQVNGCVGRDDGECLEIESQVEACIFSK